MKVELLSTWGDDWLICDVARVSFDKRSEEYTEEQNVKLINYLIKHKHTSCLRHPQLRFRIECPIYVERQLFKSQIGMSANSISGRYVDFSDSYDLPVELRKQSESSKQGSSDERIRLEIESYLITKVGNKVEKDKELYEELLREGVSKEQARVILPLCLNTKFIWTGSLLSFLHLFDLRIDSHAQKETRLVAEEMYRLIEETGQFKHTLQAWKNKDYELYLQLKKRFEGEV